MRRGSWVKLRWPLNTIFTTSRCHTLSVKPVPQMVKHRFVSFVAAKTLLNYPMAEVFPETLFVYDKPVAAASNLG